MYELVNETGSRRTYRSKITGTEIFTKVIYTDGSGGKWWAFEDLLQMPFIRKKASEKVSQLYGVGFTKEDLSGFATRLKTILKGNDTEKYEKSFSEVLNFESIVEATADPVKESLSMCAIYILSNDERIDNFSYGLAAEKIKIWAIDLDAQAFFLNWLAAGINDFKAHYQSIMQIALQMKE